MLIQLYIVSLVMVVNLLLGLVIYLKRPKFAANLGFLILTVTVTLWLLSGYLADNGLSQNMKLFFAQFSCASGLFIAGSVLHLANSLPAPQRYSAWDKIIMLVLIILAGLCFSRVIVAGVEPTPGAGTIVKNGPLYGMWLGVILVAALKAGMTFYRQWLKADKTGKKQIRTLILGFSFSLLWVFYANAVLPSLWPLFNPTFVEPVAAIILVACASYAVTRHHMFDLRYVILRFMAYVLSVAIIALVLSVSAFFVTGLIFGQQEISFGRSTYYVATAVLIALAFEPLKNLINKGTNRLFFRQSYSVHIALNQISSYATRSVDAKQIQAYVLKIVDQTVRPEYAVFLTLEPGGSLAFSASSGNYFEKALRLAGFYSELGQLRQKITIADDIKDTARLKHYLELGHIGLIVRLTTTNKSIGFLILGEKKSGSPYNGHDLQFLGLMANELALALQKAFAYDEIKAFNDTLQSKINDATKALKRTNQKLIALDDAKDDFISMASHQLRTPLTSIKGYVSMMLEGDLGKINARQREALKEAFDSSQRMVFLISDFLNVSRIRTGKFALEPVKTDLCQIIKEEIEQLRDMAGLRDQKIIFDAKQAVGQVMLDEMKIRQVMMNMIDNAIFYTPKKGTITITLERTTKEIIFKVIDTGIGVPLKVQHRLFTKFFRADNAKKARPDGTGLGLFMAQKIISAQGGKLIFKSVENKGSTFGFRFPLGKVVT